MNITGSRIMILGGPGLVGLAVCRKLLFHKPEALIICSLYKNEVDDGIAELKPIAGNTKLIGKWGNIFVRSEFKDLSRKDILGDSVRRDRFIRDTLEPLSDSVLKASFLFQMIKEERPQVIIDCINTATALAYQDVFEESRQTYALLKDFDKTDKKAFCEKVETLLGTQYTPQLIRHVQITWASLNEFNVQTYLKVGTTGTGGMGLNIPYTHSEDKPSRVLLAKSAMAGAHTMLLFLLGRTAREKTALLNDVWSPDRNIKTNPPVIKEVKPATAIAWKAVKFGEIRQKGRPVELYDMDPAQAIDSNEVLSLKQVPWKKLGTETLKAPYIDTGENGIFSRGEFEAITDEGQMEFITPEEIADTVEAEIIGGNSGADMIGAFDSAILGPTYRAGYLRARAVEQLRHMEKEHGVPSVAFENLGPPRLSKLLFELFLINQERGILEDTKKYNATQLAELCEKRVLSDTNLRSQILSLGLAIVLRNGKVLRGPNLIIPTKWETPTDGKMNADLLNRFSNAGWVDLREQNLKTWIDRLNQISKEAMEADNQNTGSLNVRNRPFWETVERDRSLGSVISWIFLREDGERVKR